MAQTVITSDHLATLGGGGGSSEPVTWETLDGKPAEFPPESHTHAAADIASGTFAVARIPALATSKITGLDATIQDLTDRIAALEAAAGGSSE